MDRETFEQAALEHLDAVFRMAMQLTHHPGEASDLVQETYLKALGACEGFEERGGGIRPWLFKIIHNVFYSRKRREARESDLIDRLRSGGAGAATNSPEDAPPAWDLATFDWEQVDERLRAAIAGLRPEYRSVLLLWGVEGMKYREIAEIENVPIGTVMSRLHRARAILAAELCGMAEEIGLQKRS